MLVELSWVEWGVKFFNRAWGSTKSGRYVWNRIIKPARRKSIILRRNICTEFRLKILSDIAETQEKARMWLFWPDPAFYLFENNNSSFEVDGTVTPVPAPMGEAADTTGIDKVSIKEVNHLSRIDSSSNQRLTGGQTMCPHSTDAQATFVRHNAALTSSGTEASSVHA